MRTFWTTAELSAQGLSRTDIGRSIGSGDRRAVRPGVVAIADVDAAPVRAVLLGGLATAHTAARSLGLWTPPDAKEAAFRRRVLEPPVLHVAVPSTAAFRNLRDPDTGLRPFVRREDVALHWTDREALRHDGGTGRVDLLLVLEHLFRCEEPARALAVLDSALHLRLLRVRDLHVLAARLPAHLRPVVFAAEERAESGVETIARYRLRAAGLAVEVQKTLDGVGRVDLLVAGASVRHRKGIGRIFSISSVNQWNQGADVEIVVPVYNEAHVLQESVWRLHRYLSEHLETVDWRVTIVDNASTDATFEVAEGLASSLNDVSAVHLDRKGRGLALRTAWTASTARVVAYLDVDLSTDLRGLAPLVAPLLSGHSDVAIGTRLSRTSRVVRGTKREFISRSYNGLLRTVLSASFSDAQCGFKAITKEAADRLLPLVRDDSWFFDTELLVLAERSGLRIHEVPVDWTDDPDSRVDIVRTATDDLKGVWRLLSDLSRHRIPVDAIAEELGRGPLAPVARPAFRSQAIRFGVVGAVSTLAYALLYLVLRPLIGGQEANFLSLLITAVGNTWANRWFTFGVTGRLGAVQHHVQGLVVFGVAWSITSGSLLALHTSAPTATPLTEILVLTAANLVATVVRFVLLRGWVFRTRRAAPDAQARHSSDDASATEAHPMELTR